MTADDAVVLEMFYFTAINVTIMFMRSASGHDLHILYLRKIIELQIMANSDIL